MDAIPDGTYLLVADQRAEKLNRNQYATAMRGAIIHFDGDGERLEASVWGSVSLQCELCELSIGQSCACQQVHQFRHTERKRRKLTASSVKCSMWAPPGRLFEGSSGAWNPRASAGRRPEPM